jgi:hypothetical protein
MNKEIEKLFEEAGIKCAIISSSHDEVQRNLLLHNSPPHICPLAFDEEIEFPKLKLHELKESCTFSQRKKFIWFTGYRNEDDEITIIVKEIMR